MTETDSQTAKQIRIRRPQRDKHPRCLRSTTHNRSILRIQQQGIREGLDWRRQGFFRGMVRFLADHITLERWNEGCAEDQAPDTRENMLQTLLEDFRACPRMIPDLWRIEMIEDEIIVHTIEVVDTCHISAVKRAAYVRLDELLEEMDIELRVMTTDRYGGEWRPFDFDAAESEVMEADYQAELRDEGKRWDG